VDVVETPFDFRGLYVHIDTIIRHPLGGDLLLLSATASMALRLEAEVALPLPLQLQLLQP
jgi:hypothetical protein